MERGLVSAEATFQRLSRRPQERRARWQRRGAEGGRPAELLTPGAVARFSFEPPRALGPSLPWYSSLEESPGSSEAERCDRLRGRSDQPAWDLAYPPKKGGVKQFPCCISGHSTLRPLQLQSAEIRVSHAYATGRRPVRFHSLLVRPHPRGGEIDDHPVPLAEVWIARFADHRAHRRPPPLLHRLSRSGGLRGAG
jgi:hypothetical protein